MKSWALPKGPSTNPKDKRLAIYTEDHPLGYAGFEGAIPEGQYGAGKVIVWDTSYYRNRTEKDGQVVEMDNALENGHIYVWLEGRKLMGGYAITETTRDLMLVKMNDELADASKDMFIAEPRSVLMAERLKKLSDDGRQV